MSRIDSFSRQKKRGLLAKKGLYFFFVALVCSVIFFREIFFSAAFYGYVKLFAPKSLGHQLSYDTCAMKGRFIFFQGLKWKGEGVEMSAESADISFNVSLFPFYLEPSVLFSKLELKLLELKESRQKKIPFALLFPSDYGRLRVDVPEGTLYLPEVLHLPTIYFSVASEDGGEILSIAAYEPDKRQNPFLSGALKKEEGGLGAKLFLDKCNISCFTPALYFLSPEHPWDRLEGCLGGSVDLSLDAKFNVQKVALELALEKLRLENNRLHVVAAAESIQGHFSYPPYQAVVEVADNLPFWKRIEAFFTVDNGYVSFASSGMDFVAGALDGEMLFVPSCDPSFTMDGNLAFDGLERQFNFKGKGLVHQDGTFWLESALSLFKQEGAGAPKTELSFSLCHLENGEFALQTECKSLLPEYLSFASKLSPTLCPLSIQRGVVDATLLVKFKQKRPYFFQCQQLKIIDLEAGLFGMQLLAPSLEGSLSFEEKEGLWRIGQLHALLPKIQMQYGERQLALMGAVHVADDHFLPCEIAAILPEGRLNATFLGPKEETFLKIDGQVLWRDCLQALSIQSDEALPLVFDIDIKEGKEGFSCEGKGCFVHDNHEEILYFGAEMEQKASCLVDWLKWTMPKRYCGWLRSERLSEAVFRPFVSLTGPIDVRGDVDLFGEFDEDMFKLSMQTENIFAQDKGFLFETGALGKKDPSLIDQSGRAELIYVSKEKKFLLDLPLCAASFLDRASGLLIERIRGPLRISEEKIESNALTASFGGAEIPFRFLSDEETLIVETKPVKGRIEEVVAALPNVKHFSLPVTIRGGFSLPEGGFCLFKQKSSPEPIAWKIDSDIFDLELSTDKACGVQNTFCHIRYDSSSSQCFVENLHGVCRGTTPYVFAIKDTSFHFDKPSSPVDLALLEGMEEIARLNGQLAFHDSEWKIQFASGAHFAGVPLSSTEINVTRDSEIGVSFHSTFEAAKLRKIYAVLRNLALLEGNEKTDAALSSLKGSITASIDYGMGDCHFSFTAPDLGCSDKALTNFELRGTKKRERYQIERLAYGKYEASFDIERRKGLILLPSFKLLSKQFSIEGEGHYDTAAKRLHVDRSSFATDGSAAKQFAFLKVDGQLNGQASFTARLDESYALIELLGQLKARAQLKGPVKADVLANKAVAFSFSPKEGLKLEGLNLSVLSGGTDELLAEVKLARLSYLPTSHELSLDRYDLSVVPRGVDTILTAADLPPSIGALRKDKFWQAAGSLRLNSSGLSMSCRLNDGIYAVGDLGLNVKNINLSIEKKTLKLRCESKLEKQPLFIELQTDLVTGSPLYALLKEVEQGPGLRLILSVGPGKIECERAQGSLCGLSIDLVKLTATDPALTYRGSAAVDFSRVKAVLPEPLRRPIEKLELAAGYEMQGDFTFPKSKQDPLRFRGTLQGSDFQCLGYSFQSLRASATLSSQLCLLEDVKLLDPVGSLSMKACRLTKDRADDSWHFFAPLVHVKEFYPSLLVKLGKKEKAKKKPFVLKNVSLYDIEGILGNVNSFKASGSLNFSQVYKKEFSMLDIPFEMLKDLGLDPRILTPAIGDVDFIIDRGKCILTDLKNSYSEGKRSEFFLNYDGSQAYLDFEGNWHVDLKMKQYVMLKLTEAFVLSIRGKLEKPKYSLKNVE